MVKVGDQRGVVTPDLRQHQCCSHDGFITASGSFVVNPAITVILAIVQNTFLIFKLVIVSAQISNLIMSRVTCAHHLARSDQKPKYQEQQGRQQRSLRCALPAGQAGAGQCRPVQASADQCRPVLSHFTCREKHLCMSVRQ